MSALAIIPFPFRPSSPGTGVSTRAMVLFALALCAFPFLITLCFLRFPFHHLSIPATVVELQVLVQFAAIALITPTLTVGAITAEFEQNTWDLLRLTQLSAIELMSVRLRLLFPRALLPIFAFLPAYVVDAAAGGLTFTSLLQLQMIAILATFLSAVTGLVCSTLSSRTSQSMLAAYLILAAVFLLPALPGHINPPISPTRPIANIQLASPLAAALASLEIRPHLHIWGHLTGMATAMALLLAIARLRIAKLLSAE